ncbi:uncharacterized protein LOC142321357 [Lycorma delicatula]|uniref:uncharacterized protein LOC142321357 n=1 Tax=Lycorma delicatula TaxID=130591 RepID=UPI003F5148CA
MLGGERGDTGRSLGGQDCIRQWCVLMLLFSLCNFCDSRSYPTFSDNSVRIYLTERTCWWNEICKEEFQTQFRCKCPQWSFCRSPGRYYNAYCTMTGTGYIWTQPDRSWSLLPV